MGYFLLEYRKLLMIAILINWTAFAKENGCPDDIDLIRKTRLYEGKPSAEGCICFNSVKKQNSGALVGHAPDLEFLTKNLHFNATNPFYFLFVTKIFAFDGSKVIRSEIFPALDDKAYAIIVLSVEHKRYLEIREDHSLFIKDKEQITNTGLRVKAYSLNPAILALEDGSFVKVQNAETAKEMFQDLPQLKRLLPPITEIKVGVHNIEFVDRKIVLLRRENYLHPFDEMTIIRSEEGDSVKEWKLIGNRLLKFEGSNGYKNRIMYIDEDDDGLFAVQLDGNRYAINQMMIDDDELEKTGLQYGTLGYVYPFPFISSSARIVVFEWDERVFKSATRTGIPPVIGSY